MGGRRVVASGALWGSKGDVRSDKFLIECKTTGQSFYSLKSSVWEKVEKEALKDGIRIPVMCVEVCCGKYKKCVILYRDFTMLLGGLPSKLSPFGYTGYKSFSIHHDMENVFINMHLSATVHRRLVVIPWDDFLEMSSHI
jgi:hypothetical protein